MVSLARPDLIEKLPGWGAAAGAAVVGLGFLALPGAWLETAVQASGVAALIPVAEAPLGMTARAVLALGGGALVAAVAWAALYLLFGEGGFLAAKVSRADDAPAVRRADAHPDAPPRRPPSAAELDGPMWRDEPEEIATPIAVEQDLPADLDTPLAALDPAAIPSVPMEPVRAVAPLAPGERLQTFALTPPAPPKPQPMSEPPSIDALLRRLEQGAGRRVAAR